MHERGKAGEGVLFECQTCEKKNLCSKKKELTKVLGSKNPSVGSLKRFPIHSLLGGTLSSYSTLLILLTLAAYFLVPSTLVNSVTGPVEKYHFSPG